MKLNQPIKRSLPVSNGVACLIFSASVLQDLRCALQKARSELQAKEAALKESDAERHAAMQEKDRSIAQLKRSVQEKEQQLQVARAIPRTFSANGMQLHIG